DWGGDFPSGALVSLDLAACLRDVDSVKPALIVAPGPRESVEDAAATRDRLLVTVYRNVQGNLASYRFEDGTWRASPVKLPKNASMHMAATSNREDRAFIDVAGFLDPNTLWLEKGGVYVIANIRGGGEFGPEWHQAALKSGRRHAFEDFIAVAEDLIRRNITSPRRLGMMGGSNGGLLMGVMLTQRPDLFHAIVIQVPLLDMLRYHKLLAG